MRKRLQESPSLVGKLDLIGNHLHEAAAAFKIPLKLENKNWKTKPVLVEQILVAVLSATGRTEEMPPVLPEQRVQATTADEAVDRFPNLQSRRYDFEFWGKTGRTAGGRCRKASHNRPGGDAVERHQSELDAKWDVSLCRQLLPQFAESNLRERLHDSPWLQGKACASVNWLKEAAAAFSVPIKLSKSSGVNSGTCRAKDDIVEDVMQAARYARTLGEHSAAARDEQRRRFRLSSLVQRADVLAARRQAALLPSVVGMDFQQMREDVLLFECPDELRKQIVTELIARHGPLPREDATDLGERRAALYYQSALGRLHLSTAMGPQLTLEDGLGWEAVWATLPAEFAPIWPEDPVLLRTQTFYAEHGHLNPQKREKAKQLSEAEREEDRLARELDVVRRTKPQDVRHYVRRAGKDTNSWSTLLRRKLSAEAVAKWQNTFGSAWAWLPGRFKETYVPGAALLGSRHEWSRVPYFCKAVGCYLCGADFDCKADLLKHWRAAHLDLPAEVVRSMSDHRVEEEVRTRFFHDEFYQGPLEVRGQEMRRMVGTHSTHQTQSVPGSGHINHSTPVYNAVPRGLGGYAICARSFWLEELYDLELFTAPAANAGEAAEDAPQCAGQRVVNFEDEDAAAAPIAGCRRYAVKAKCAEKVNRLLDVRRYQRRFPKIPKHELYASSVQHPHVPEWRWLLHTHRVPKMERRPDGSYPPVPACRNCAFCLIADTPQKVEMPRYALADDNWIGRMPFAFTPGGELLGKMTLKTLARGRTCIDTVIAEPEKPTAPKLKQKGLRGNSIALPQAKLELQDADELPPPPDRMADFLSKSVIIALAGVDKEDLHKARWAEIPLQDYVDAARVLTSHGMAYHGVALNEERAFELFAARGRTIDAVQERAAPIAAIGSLPYRLNGPADTGCAGTAEGATGGCASGACEQEVAIDGESCSEQDEDDAAADLNAGQPDEDQPTEIQPEMSFCGDSATSGDVDEIHAIRKVYDELSALRDAAIADAEEDAVAARPQRTRVRSLQMAVQALMSPQMTDGIERAAANAEAKEKGTSRKLPGDAYALHTGSQPLSMYSAASWAMCFPHLFPYGDGVFGLPRQRPLTFQQLAVMLDLREELCYDISPEMVTTAATFSQAPETIEDGTEGVAQASGCACSQCLQACLPFRPQRQSRWGGDLEYQCCSYDTWRRMEQIRRAEAHVTRVGYKQKLERICNASAEKIEAAIACVGEGGTLRDVLRSVDCDKDLKEALSEPRIFTSDVVGSDGARAQLRHEQNGFSLKFGPSGAFVTPNLADVRSPVVVLLHGGGVEERYTVNLMDECPVMPSARDMLQIVAQDPVAQARYFIIAMRLFCEHVLGCGPMDSMLRHNGRLECPAFPDGYAASGLGGAVGIVAAFHGPVEEQARLSIHPHMHIWHVHGGSEAWMRSMLRREDEQSRARWRLWQERVLAFAQSMQLGPAAVLPLLLTDEPDAAPPPRSTPFSEQRQKDCRFDGKLESDERDPQKRRPLLATEGIFVDHHIREHLAQLPAGMEEPRSKHTLPLTSAQLTRMPHYRLLQPMTERVPVTDEERREEARLWSATFSEDYRMNISVTQMRVHQPTCFKYVVQQSRKKAKHCRFNFNHFVTLALSRITDGVEKVREIVFARTGKNLVLPRRPGEGAPEHSRLDPGTGEPIPFRPTNRLGPTVLTDSARGMCGRVQVIRWNPLEGSSNGVAQVCIRGNMDCQSMLRTFTDGFDPGRRDALRDAPVTDADIEEEERRRDAAFEAELPGRIQKLQAERQKKGLPRKAHDELEAGLRSAHQFRIIASRRGECIGDRLLSPAERRFKQYVRAMLVEAMAATQASTFYACDYPTKPNMTCAPLLENLQNGMRKLEQTLAEEREKERLEELRATSVSLEMRADGASVSAHIEYAGKEKPHAAEAVQFAAAGADASGTRSDAASAATQKKGRAMTKLEREASHRLIRQVTAMQSAQVQGHCLMIMQVLTRREVIKSHFAWQLQVRQPMWRAFEYQRQLEGLSSQAAAGPVPISTLEVDVAPAGETAGDEHVVDADVADLSKNSDDADENADANDLCSNSEDECAQEAQLKDATENTDAAANPQHGAASSTRQAQSPIVKLTRRNDNFYEDCCNKGFAYR